MPQLHESLCIAATGPEARAAVRAGWALDSGAAKALWAGDRAGRAPRELRTDVALAVAVTAALRTANSSELQLANATLATTVLTVCGSHQTEICQINRSTGSPD